MISEIVSIIGSSYFEPISALLEKLEKYDKGNSSGFQAGYYVNGYSASICILAVICLESYVMRARYMNKAKDRELDRMSVPDYLKKLYPDFPLQEEAIEIFILRDILAHNHLWEISLYLEEGVGMKERDTTRKSSGDKKYLSSVTEETGKTKILGLNTNPIKVCSTDAKLVLKKMWSILIFLETKDRNQCYVSHLHTTYKGSQVKMGELVGLSDTCT